MSITVEINPVLEKKLREKAARKGVGLNHFIQTELEKIVAKEDIPYSHRVGKEESKLLQKINLGLSAAFWEKYREFIRIKETRILNETELTEFIRMTDQVEAANARRMRYLVELANLREIPLRQLMDDLGIKAGSYV